MHHIILFIWLLKYPKNINIHLIITVWCCVYWIRYGFIWPRVSHSEDFRWNVCIMYFWYGHVYRAQAHTSPSHARAHSTCNNIHISILLHRLLLWRRGNSNIRNVAFWLNGNVNSLWPESMNCIPMFATTTTHSFSLPVATFYRCPVPYVLQLKSLFHLWNRLSAARKYIHFRANIWLQWK